MERATTQAPRRCECFVGTAVRDQRCPTCPFAPRVTANFGEGLEREARRALRRHAKMEDDVRWMRPVLDALDHYAEIKDPS